MNYTVEKTAVIGLGLMGGSLCLALKKAGYGGCLSVYARREETVHLACSTGMCDEGSCDIEQAVRGADVVVICVPVKRIAEMVDRIKPYVKANAVITDVGSTKAWLHEEIEPLLKGTGAFFAGSHPIAGSEQTGAEHARIDLYKNAVCVITGTDTIPENIHETVQALWETAGCRVMTMTPDAHDKMLARTSHLPHLVSVALSRHCGSESGEDVSTFCGTGYADMTRLAGGSVEMWCDIVETNRNAILEEITAMRAELLLLEDAVKNDERAALGKYLEEGKSRRHLNVQQTGVE